MLNATGHDEISLSSLSSSDYSELEALTDYLIDDLSRTERNKHFSAVPAYRCVLSGCYVQSAGYYVRAV